MSGISELTKRKFKEAIRKLGFPDDVKIEKVKEKEVSGKYRWYVDFEVMDYIFRLTMSYHGQVDPHEEEETSWSVSVKKDGTFGMPTNRYKPHWGGPYNKKRKSDRLSPEEMQEMVEEAWNRK